VPKLRTLLASERRIRPVGAMKEEFLIFL